MFRQRGRLFALVGLPLAVILGTLAVGIRLNWAVSEWEQMAVPVRNPDGYLRSLTGVYNTHPNATGYFLWATGNEWDSLIGDHAGLGMIYMYDRGSWRINYGLGSSSTIPGFGSGRGSGRGITSYLFDKDGDGSADTYRLWVAGGKIHQHDATAHVGGIAYAEMPRQYQGTMPVWNACVPSGSGACVASDTMLFTGNAGINASRVDSTDRRLNAIDFMNKDVGVAVGDGCSVWTTIDGGRNWTRTSDPPGCTATVAIQRYPACRWFLNDNDLTAVQFSRDYDAPEVMENIARRPVAWITGLRTDQVWSLKYAAGVFTWTQNPAYTRIRQADDSGWITAANQNWRGLASIYRNGQYHTWVGGSALDSDGLQGKTRYFSCTEALCTDTTPDPMGPGGPEGEIGSGAIPISGLTVALEKATDPLQDKYFVWASVGKEEITVTFDDYDPATETHPWPDCDDPLGSDIKTTFSDGAIYETSNPRDGSVVDPTPGAGATWILQRIPSNLGLIGITAVNPGHAWAVGDKQTLLQMSPGNITGAAWIGADDCATRYRLGGPSVDCDPAQDRELPLGWINLNCANTRACQTKEFSYGLDLRYKLDSVVLCSDDPNADVGAISGYGWLGTSDPQQQDPTLPPEEDTCAENPDICKPIGWLSFERSARTGDPPGEPYAAFDSDGFVTPCGKQITETSTAKYVMSTYNYDNARVEGWAKFLDSGGNGWVKLRGPYRCGTAWCTEDRTMTCTDSGDCTGGNGICDTDAPGGAAATACPVATAGDQSHHYYQCNDCVSDPKDPADQTDDALTCNICTHVLTKDWWNSAYQFRRQVKVDNSAGSKAVDAGTTLELITDLDVFSVAPYNDVRMIYRSLTSSSELAREIVPFDATRERIRFKSTAVIPQGAFDDRYYLYHGNPAPSAPLNDPKNVYHLYEPFATASVMNQWTPDARTNPPPDVCLDAFEYDAAGQFLKKTKNSSGADCKFNNKNLPMDMRFDWNVEADVRIDDGPVSNVSLNFQDANDIEDGFTNHQGYIAGLYLRTSAPAGQSVFVHNNAAAPAFWTRSNTMTAPPTPIIQGTWYPLRLEYRYANANSRKFSIWVNGIKYLDQVEDIQPNFPVEFAYPGVHTWQGSGTPTKTSWDNLKFWKTTTATADLTGLIQDVTTVAAPTNPLENWSCNKCGSANQAHLCGTGRCIPGSPDASKVGLPCLNDDQCGDLVNDPATFCDAAGHCEDDGAVCWSDLTCDLSGAVKCAGIGENICDTCDSCSLYGVSLDLNAGSLHGYGYSEDFGFIDFSYAFLYNQAWLRVLRGDIYSRSSIGNTVGGKAPGLQAAGPADKCNATYAIRSNGAIVNVCSEFQPGNVPPASEQEASPFIRPDFAGLDLPKGGNQYRTALGRIDIPGLITRVDGNDNRYGQEVVILNDALDGKFSTAYGLVMGSNPCLGNKVYHWSEVAERPTFTFDWTLANPPAPTFSICPQARATFIIEGNLTFETDSFYDAGPPFPQGIREIPSIGFIVLPTSTNPSPTITFKKNVQHTVGNFYTEGTIITESEEDARKGDKQFVNEGVMVASKFEFHRRYRGTIDNPHPSEEIINDGRLNLNPPPGFDNVNAVLPNIFDTVQ